MVVSYGPAPLLRQRGLDTKHIIVPFSSKGVNYVAYPAHLANVYGVCDTVCLTIMPSFSDITDVSTIGHSFKTNRSPPPPSYFTSAAVLILLVQIDIEFDVRRIVYQDELSPNAVTPSVSS